MTLQELGQSIREKREAAELSIEDVAGRIKVSARILRSIEEGSLVGLPHAVYTKSFIKSFGLVVGFDPEQLTTHLDALFPPESLDETRNEPGPRTRTVAMHSGNGKRMAVLCVLLAFLAGIGYGGWYVAKTYGDDILELVKAPFSAVTSPLPDGEERPAASEEPASPAPATSRRNDSRISPATALRPEAQAPATPVLRNETPPPPAMTARNSAVVPDSAGRESEGPSPGGSAQGVPTTLSTAPAPAGVGVSEAVPAQSEQRRTDGKKHLKIAATQSCWVSFRADGVKGRDVIMQPGEQLTLSYSTNIEVVFGNAGGVSLTDNGRAIGSPGRPGHRAVARFPRASE